MSKGMMALLVECPGEFPLKIEYKGKSLKVYSCSVRDEFKQADRMRYLLRELIDELNLGPEELNKVGFSQEDAGELSMHIDGLENINPPHWEL